MSRLEQRYRLVLRVLPAAYRKAWEEDMVATFLDSVDSDDAEAAEYAADYGRPSWSEVATVASLAVRRCLGAAPLRGLGPDGAAGSADGTAGQRRRGDDRGGIDAVACHCIKAWGRPATISRRWPCPSGEDRHAASPKCSRLGRLGGALQHPTAPSGHRSGATGHAVPVGSGRPAADRRPSRRWWPAGVIRWVAQHDKNSLAAAEYLKDRARPQRAASPPNGSATGGGHASRYRIGIAPVRLACRLAST
jgi:hypothetical protein